MVAHSFSAYISTWKSFRTLADEHRRYHADFDDTARVEIMLVVLETSADASPYEVPPSPIPDDVPPADEPFPGADAPNTDEEEADPPTLAMIAGYESEQEDWPALRDGPLWTPPATAANLASDPTA
ncbi:hypothetical protein CYMTET_53606 [Cymbomonas tetramitiformis]|uniref:Uncharacterized protein n=1 Tax=Cymbomonas tetramitiformis TaxID=36881 RepID=A0AAE0BIE7_9CHLO|nr:hypothetical protein CYMTET_53606 [Cymbomonas tetramitiformis]